ncbi:ABC-F family ATP-binding cassette domain-containing protein [Clostridium perfringens]|uniref:ABC transporter, ATP-binding protein n=1 Tax=Clostridium perfringens (strain ATCC 13124 / DSM 756 / JCM 1290 / NCIMB 6125 / NCTC 8237 / Type A) TaxID=195103 RepID=A0A0H2YT49_CLOP1|nr:ABC-F family ATP-binding cassette domain-containing protein [Clostridium perfringens]ABG84225.1 ABC transporter, ATP-binding protein [Clostridium perfringens ATCC 13124]AMN34032.1 ABC transporter [Clostridium perfringens]EIF6154891.1 ABC-F family ATP-binding cassette domain-containing protein [Clostridium perfringens]EJT6493544.1 ABC-F family ATP-binding cassette domain-containing protein [Clostridium perfringens]ELC8342246.1 ABC-F family ATP-binding cassette domain-containing protein [Clos
MNLITLENISKSYSEKILANNVSLGINEGEKIGLIGVNGTGKSSFLKIVAGVEEPDEGTVTKGNRVRIEYLAQTPDYDDNATVLEQVFKGNSEEMRILREYEELLEKIDKGEVKENDSERLIRLQGKIDALNLWDMESEAKNVLTKLGITNFEEKVGNLSGGQKKRIMLAAALITPCELLILDEPTNHLDNETISWLEEYLNSRKGALLMITHDRYFLDRVTNRILELDRGRLFSYDGNYSVFLEKKMERIAIEKASEEKRQNLMRKELAWVRRGAKARTTKQKARLQRFDKLVNQEGFIENENIEISVMGTRLGKKIIEIEHLNKSFGDKKIVDDFNYIVLRSDRIGIVGPNGIGKSTLMGMIEGKVAPDSGEIIKGETVKIACFSQEDTHMHPEMRAIDYIKEAGEYLQTATGERITASQMCEKFLFDGTLQWTMIGMLSGGERRRLHLLRVLMEAPNVLLLDEPTNDLDIETLNRLEDYLDDFGGVVITVSHDRYFLDRICNKIFSYEGNGKIDIYTGNYGDYLLSKEEDAVNNKEKEVAVDKNKKEPSVDKNKNKGKVLKFSFKEQREFETIDEEIMTLEEKIEELDSLMAKHASEYGRLQELMEEKSKVEEELAFKYERWEYLNELAAQIEENKKNK